MRRYEAGAKSYLPVVAAFLSGGALLGPLTHRWLGAEALTPDARPTLSAEAVAPHGSECTAKAPLESATTPPRPHAVAATECEGPLQLYAGGVPSEVRAAAPPAEVIALHAERLLLRLASGERCDLPLRGRWIANTPEPASAPAASATDAPVAGASGGLSSADFATAFRRSDERHYTVDVDLLRTVLDNGGDAVTDIALTPEPSAAGARLGAYTGLFKYLGLVQGDLLLAANEAPITEVDDLVQSFSSITQRQPLALRIRRDGRELTVQYASD